MPLRCTLAGLLVVPAVGMLENCPAISPAMILLLTTLGGVIGVVID
jgi:hypothetical protein